jgi:uncharacterized membrane protein YjgN (DUF898 family)
MSAITADDSIPSSNDRPAARPARASSATDGSAGSRGHEHPVRFTASGGEYFRIWVVNLLLTLATLGIYAPWAKVRKLRYFYGNTVIGGHPMDFHGDPKRMFRGSALAFLFFIVYSVAAEFSALAGLVALGFIVVLAPALFRSSMRFRMANTSWRGMRMHFTGDLRGAYLALVPILLAVAVFATLTMLVPEKPPAGEGARQARHIPDWLGWSLAGSMLALLALIPWTFWAIKRYQHDHYALGRVTTQFRAGPLSFYGLYLKLFGLNLLFIGVPVALIGAAVAGGGTAWFKENILTLMALAPVLYVLFLATNKSFYVSRLQNLMWNRTKSSQVRFESRLRLLPLAGLILKNGVLLVLTLGLYWPFAAVAMARIKLESVTVFTRRPVDELAGRTVSAGEHDAAGDAAGDMFGFDVGY